MFSKATNSDKAAYGFYHSAEHELSTRMDQQKLDFSDASKVVEHMFYPNIGSSKFQERTERYLIEKFDSEAINEIQRLSKAIFGRKYEVKIPKLREDLLTAVSL